MARLLLLISMLCTCTSAPEECDGGNLPVDFHTAAGCALSATISCTPYGKSGGGSGPLPVVQCDAGTGPDASIASFQVFAPSHCLATFDCSDGRQQTIDTDFGYYANGLCVVPAAPNLTVCTSADGGGDN